VDFDLALDLALQIIRAVREGMRRGLKQGPPASRSRAKDGVYPRAYAGVLGGTPPAVLDLALDFLFKKLYYVV
jgi:hypothetical protein